MTNHGLGVDEYWLIMGMEINNGYLWTLLKEWTLALIFSWCWDTPTCDRYNACIMDTYLGFKIIRPRIHMVPMWTMGGLVRGLASTTQGDRYPDVYTLPWSKPWEKNMSLGFPAGCNVYRLHWRKPREIMSIGLSAGCLKLEAVLSRQTRHLGTLTWWGAICLYLRVWHLQLPLINNWFQCFSMKW